MMPREERTKQIQDHLDAIRHLQAEDVADVVGEEPAAVTWPPKEYYWLFHVLIGMMLGFLGATASLMFNIVGSLLVNQHPLKIIQVYLTFPMGEAALDPNTSSGKVLFVGCVLYLITGGIYGIAFHILMNRWFAGQPFGKRFLIASIIGLGLWVVNFYLILSWLQPALLGKAWILTEIPFWVAALTHLVFAWTMLAVEGWGRFERRRHEGLVSGV